MVTIYDSLNVSSKVYHPRQVELSLQRFAELKKVLFIQVNAHPTVGNANKFWTLNYISIKLYIEIFFQS